MPSLRAVTAVLLFALPDAVEAARKPVAKQSAPVWRAMRAVNRQKVKEAGLELLESTRLIEHRGTFGEQFSAAVSAVFARGFQRVICIGNDCPDLSVADLRRAAVTLAGGQPILGADQRGGVYLVGFDRAHFETDVFSRLPWQTSRVIDALRNYFSVRGQYPIELTVHTDVNRRTDATAVRWHVPVARRWLMTLRQALLAVIMPLLLLLPVQWAWAPVALFAGRAPPVGG